MNEKEINKRNKLLESDTIDDFVKHEIGSIKEVRIDGLLDKKIVWTGTKWQNVCRYLNCREYSDNKGLCKKHYSEEVSKNIVGEIKIRGSKSYKWDGKQWRMLCSVELCESPVENHKTGKCRPHNKNPDVLYSGTHHALNLYNNIKSQMDIEKRKKKMTETKNKK